MIIALGILALAVLFMMLNAWQLALGLFIIALLASLCLSVHWAFWPRHTLPRHRVRHLKMRLFCRLHPGKGHATIFELRKHWSSKASAEKDRYARP